MKYFLVRLTTSVNRHGPVRVLSPLRIEFGLAVLSGTALVAVVGKGFEADAGLALALALFVLAAGVAALGMHRSYPHRELGLCNFITLSRLALTAALGALLVAPLPISDATLWLAFAVALTALLLDGIDGWAARRAGLASRFGARFDLEVDAFLALVLSLLAYRTGEVGPWILALGLPRYLFLVAGTVWPHLRRDLPDKLGRKVVCVLQIGTLVAFLVPVLPPTLLAGAAGLTLLALAWSFWRDIHFLTSASR